jgi:hypothetical protein
MVAATRTLLLIGHPVVASTAAGKRASFCRLPAVVATDNMAVCPTAAAATSDAGVGSVPTWVTDPVLGS